MDLAAVQAMTAALAGTNKAFILSSGSAFVGDTGPAPVDESYPIDPETPGRIRVESERVSQFGVPCKTTNVSTLSECHVSSSLHAQLNACRSQSRLRAMGCARSPSDYLFLFGATAKAKMPAMLASLEDR